MLASTKELNFGRTMKTMKNCISNRYNLVKAFSVATWRQMKMNKGSMKKSQGIVQHGDRQSTCKFGRLWLWDSVCFCFLNFGWWSSDLRRTKIVRVVILSVWLMPWWRITISNTPPFPKSVPRLQVSFLPKRTCLYI
jgi:hypothetical protein